MEAMLGDLLSNVDWLEIGWASWDTLVMVGLSLLFSILIGLPIGVVLFLTGKRQLLDQPA
ncbi:MAG TPA: metal ABC transporter permease, partial [Marinobacter sp.]|nr:metal ABC transporter permease [Marinobacter sp.]